MDNAHKHAQLDMLKMGIVSEIKNALIRDADCVAQMDFVTNAFLITVENHNVNGNNYSHRCSCHSLSLHSLCTLLSLQFSSSLQKVH